jgi:hypothetical protein
MLRPYEARLVGSQGFHKFPHTVMALAAKAPAPRDFAARAGRLVEAYRDEQARAEAAAPWTAKVRRSLARVYRSKGERHHLSAYYKADFVLEGVTTDTELARVG